MSDKAPTREAAAKSTKANYDLFQTAFRLKKTKQPEQSSSKNQEETTIKKKSTSISKLDTTSQETLETLKSLDDEDSAHDEADAQIFHNTPTVNTLDNSQVDVQSQHEEKEDEAKTSDHELLRVPTPPPQTSHLIRDSHSAPDNRVAKPDDDTHTNDVNKILNDLILEKAKHVEDSKQKTTVEKPNELDINKVTSAIMLNPDYTPFSHEDSLPPFDHGSIGFHYFQTLRNIMDKCIRAQRQKTFLDECFNKKIIPRGFELNKRLMAVDPTPKLKLEFFKISSQAETAMMQAVSDHYEVAIPKLQDEFNTYYKESQELPPTEKRLVVLKLIHYKNSMLSDNTTYNKKIDSLTEPDDRDSRARMSRDTTRRPTYNDTRGRYDPSTSRGPGNSRDYSRQRRPENITFSTNANLDEDWKENANENWNHPNGAPGGRFPPPKEQRFPKPRGRGRGRF